MSDRPDELLRALWHLWNDPQSCRMKADYMKGHLSYANSLNEREAPIRAYLSENQPNDAGGDAGTNRRQGGEESVARDASETSTVNQRPDPASPPQPIAAMPRLIVGPSQDPDVTQGQPMTASPLVIGRDPTWPTTPQDQTAQPTEPLPREPNETMVKAMLRELVKVNGWVNNDSLAAAWTAGHDAFTKSKP